jgi:hypothetical protein
MAIKTSTDLIKAPAHALGSPDDVDYAFRTRVVRVKLPADAAANTATEHLLAISEVPIVINSIKVLPQTSAAMPIAADATDYTTIALQTGDLAAGSLATAIASKDTRAASLNGLAANTLATIGSGLVSSVAANQRISLNVTKAGAGKQLPVLLVELTYQLA